MTTIPDRDLALEIVRATESGALAASRLVGRGDKIAADQAAVDGMRSLFDTVSMDGIVVIGEGEKDEAPMLYNGEHVGDGSGPEVDVAVDPLEGTTLAAKGMPNALCVVAISARGSMFDPGPCVYMEKLAGGPDLTDALSLTDPIEDVLFAVAKRRGVAMGDLMVVVLDRPRHAEMITRMREAGARIRLISDGDVSGVLLAAMPDTGIDLLWGIGGTPEGVLSAAAIRCVGGTILGRLWPRDDDEATLARNAGYDLERVLTTDDLVASEDCFFAATGVTDGDLVRGVRFDATGATTQSLVMRARSGTIRKVDAHHHRAKLRALMGDRYG
jgi:fructose-1,6-bisphosphatase II